ncbi:hypothetical protein S40288_01394 [Stachybotrys chartarum IBT 40288]|nr:hypothetical protein S40288_01394 [Stachybotrys chartarum IBT 40288]
MDLDLEHSAALGNELTSNTTLTEIRNPDVEKQTIAVAVLISVSCVVVVGIAVAAMRCASGQWSVVMDSAQGTFCTPSGFTDDFRIEHDGSVNGDGTSSGGAKSRGSGIVSIVGCCLLSAMVVLWTVLV